MKYGKYLKRYTAAAVLVTMLAGSVSAVSYAFDRHSRVLYEDGQWDQKIRTGAYDDKRATLSSATPSSPSGRRSIKKDQDHRLATPGNMLDQTGDSEDALESIEVEWFRVLLDGEVIRDSSRPQLEMEEGREIEPNGKMTLKLKAFFHVDAGQIQPGNYVEWNLGSYPGLALPEAISEDIVINQTPFGYAYLHYEEDGRISLGTVFEEELDSFGTVYIEYTYESGFLPVYEKTPLHFRFPGQEKERTAILLPTDRPGPEESEPEASEPTTQVPEEPETTIPETTIPESTVPETTAPETVAPETSPGRPSGGGSSGGEGSSSNEVNRQPESLMEEASEPLEEAETKEQETEAVELMASEPDQETDKAPVPDMAEGQPEDLQKPEKLSVRISGSAGESGTVVQNGDILSCTIEVRNESETLVEDIRLREYLPEHVSFLSASGGGVWAIQDGRQRITWKLDELGAGESRVFNVRMQVYPCTPPGYSLKQSIFCQEEDRESVYSPKDPERSVEAPVITVG